MATWHLHVFFLLLLVKKMYMINYVRSNLWSCADNNAYNGLDHEPWKCRYFLE